MAFLPPSSRLTSFGPTSIAAAATLRPVGTEPVKDTAPTPGVDGEGGGRLGAAVHDLEQVGGDAGLDARVDEGHAAGRRQLGGLHHDAVAGQQGREDLPATGWPSGSSTA